MVYWSLYRKQDSTILKKWGPRDPRKRLSERRDTVAAQNETERPIIQSEED